MIIHENILEFSYISTLQKSCSHMKQNILQIIALEEPSEIVAIKEHTKRKFSEFTYMQHSTIRFFQN